MPIRTTLNVAPADLIKNPIFSRGVRIKISIADSDLALGAYFDSWIWIRDKIFPDIGSRIPNPHIE
jgi:hypothetical protein